MARHTMNERWLRVYIDSVFDKYDDNGDGFLVKAEIKHMLRGIVGKRMSSDPDEEMLEKYVERFIRRADPEGTGKITKSDFYAFYKSK